LVGVYFQLIEKGMPRKARIDAAGAPQHIIVRGIERRKIFYDDKDRDAFVERLTAVIACLRVNVAMIGKMPTIYLVFILAGCVASPQILR
jgi:hypothetical protein